MGKEGAGGSTHANYWALLAKKTRPRGKESSRISVSLNIGQGLTPGRGSVRGTGGVRSTQSRCSVVQRERRKGSKSKCS